VPVDKTPLFVGGSGVTVEEREGKLLICVYPVATHAAADFTLPEGGQSIHVDVTGLPAGAQWTGISVRDSAGKRIEAQRSKYAFTFSPQAGKSYSIRALP
jgi:hypothetical protein